MARTRHGSLMAARGAGLSGSSTPLVMQPRLILRFLIGIVSDYPPVSGAPDAAWAMPSPLYLHVFISSPGDVSDERALARRLLSSELCLDPFLRDRVSFDVVSWDNPAAPIPMVASLTPQEAINRFGRKPSQCQIVVLILWSRMGTHLDVAKFRKRNGDPYLSGTEWEFEDAFNADPQPLILVFRRTEEVSIKTSDPLRYERLRQFDLVQNFFESFRNSEGRHVGGVNEYATPTEFKSKLEHSVKLHLHQLLGDAQNISPTRARTWTDSPYPGLRPFTTDEAPIFCGRERETDALIARLRAPDQRFLAVIGTSGTGKSSVIRAGVLPRLAEGAISNSEHWRVVAFTPAGAGENPFLALAVELARELPPDERRPALEIAKALAVAPQRIAEYATTLLAGRPHEAIVLLFIDQLEELFTVVSEHYRAAFVALLAHASSADSKLRTVATLRADFLPECAAEPVLRQLLQAQPGPFIVGPPDRLALDAMIREPASRAGFAVEDKLAQNLIEDAGSDPGALPLVAFCLQELYCRSMSRQLLTAAAYEDLGRLRGAIGKHADAAIERLRQEEGDAAIDAALPQVLQALVHTEQRVSTGIAVARRRAFRDELAREGLLTRVVDAMTGARLLTAGTVGRRATVELAHEALFEAWPALRNWLEGNRADLMLRDELALDLERWERANSDPGFLLSKGKRLQDALTLVDRRPDLVDQRLASYIRSSQVRARFEAEEWEKLWHYSLRLSALSRRETGRNPVTAILLALEALPIDLDMPDRPLVGEAVVALHGALQLYSQQALRGHKDAVLAAAFSPDGTRLITTSKDHTALVWDLSVPEVSVVVHGHRHGIRSAAFSPDGTRVIIGSEDGSARLCSAATGEEFGLLVSISHGNCINSVTFSPDGTQVITGSEDGTARLWNAVTGEELDVLMCHGNCVNSVAFSLDGARVITGSDDGTATVWDAAWGEELVSLVGHQGAIRSAAFSADGACAITASSDATAVLWDLASGREIVVLRGHRKGVHSAAFSPDGARAITASADGTARLWDVVSGEEEALLRGHKGVVCAAGFSPDGTRAVTASWDGTARLWPIFATTRDVIETARKVVPRKLTPEEREQFDLAASSIRQVEKP